MEKEAVINQIRQAGSEDIQDLLDATIARYKALYPEWEIFFFSLRANDREERLKEMERIIHFAFKYGI